MSARKKLRAIMAGKRLVLMPGAYDALSARIIESELDCLGAHLHRGLVESAERVQADADDRYVIGHVRGLSRRAGRRR